MNKYKIDSMVIRVKEEEKKNNDLCMQIMLLFWVCKTYTPSLNGIIILVTGKIFSRNQMKTRQENADF